MVDVAAVVASLVVPPVLAFSLKRRWLGILLGVVWFWGMMALSVKYAAATGREYQSIAPRAMVPFGWAFGAVYCAPWQLVTPGVRGLGREPTWKRSAALLAGGLLGVACAIGLLAVSRNRKRSAWLEAQRLPGALPEAPLSAADRARLEREAREAVAMLAIPEHCEPYIQENDTEYIVTFPVWRRRIVPGSSYYAQITIEKASGKVLKKLGADR
ncbi:MAG: hypothetical protein ACYS9X_04110 [Planctomycetota bacterium]|jgi:hypothetical protein